MEAHSNDIVMAELQKGLFQPCKIISQLANHKFLVFFYQQNLETILDASALHPYQSQPHSTSLLEEKETISSPIICSLSPSDPRVAESKETQSNKTRKSKNEQLRLKRTQKQLQKKSHDSSSKKSQSKLMGNSLCWQLRMLLEKLGDSVSNSGKEQQDVFSQFQLKRLKEMLGLKFNLDLEEMLHEWIIQTMIVLLKEIQQWGLPRHPELEHILRQKYQQIKERVLSDAFYEVKIPDQKRKRLILKIKLNSINIPN